MRRVPRHPPEELARKADLNRLATPWAQAWSPSGVIEVLEPLVNTERRQKLHSLLDARLDSVTVMLDTPYDPHNTAAVVRSCDAFGVQQVHILEGDELTVSRRVAQGADRWVDVEAHQKPERAVSALEAAGYQLVAAHPEGELVPEDLARLPRVAILLGNEHAGLSPKVSERATRTVRIPMRGFVESLNLSVSAALLVRAATAGRPGDLALDKRQHLYARGLFRSLTRAQDILGASTPH